MGLIRLLMFYTSLAPPPFVALDGPLFVAFPRSRRLSRPWPRFLRLGTGLNAFGIGRPAFPAVDGYLAPGPASFGWASGSTPSASDGRLSDDRNGCSGPQSRLPESARVGSVAGFSESLQTTFPMN